MSYLTIPLPKEHARVSESTVLQDLADLTVGEHVIAPVLVRGCDGLSPQDRAAVSSFIAKGVADGVNGWEDKELAGASMEGVICAYKAMDSLSLLTFSSSNTGITVIATALVDAVIRIPDFDSRLVGCQYVLDACQEYHFLKDLIARTLAQKVILNASTLSQVHAVIEWFYLRKFLEKPDGLAPLAAEWVASKHWNMDNSPGNGAYAFMNNVFYNLHKKIRNALTITIRERFVHERGTTRAFVEEFTTIQIPRRLRVTPFDDGTRHIDQAHWHQLAMAWLMISIDRADEAERIIVWHLAAKYHVDYGTSDVVPSQAVAWYFHANLPLIRKHRQFLGLFDLPYEYALGVSLPYAAHVIEVLDRTGWDVHEADAVLTNEWSTYGEWTTITRKSKRSVLQGYRRLALSGGGRDSYRCWQTAVRISQKPPTNLREISVALWACMVPEIIGAGHRLDFTY